MIEPTVGRVVWYRHPHEEPPYPRLGEQPYAAHIAFVHSPRLLNLLVIDHNGHPYPAQNILLLQDGDAPPVGAPYAEWMPYQKGQAAKAEALQTQLGAGQAQAPAPQQAAQPPVQAAPPASPPPPPQADPVPQQAAQAPAAQAGAQE